MTGRQDNGGQHDVLPKQGVKGQLLAVTVNDVLREYGDGSSQPEAQPNFAGAKAIGHPDNHGAKVNDPEINCDGLSRHWHNHGDAISRLKPASGKAGGDFLHKVGQGSESHGLEGAAFALMNDGSCLWRPGKATFDNIELRIHEPMRVFGAVGQIKETRPRPLEMDAQALDGRLPIGFSIFDRPGVQRLIICDARRGA